MTVDMGNVKIMENEVFYRIALTFVEGVGVKTARKLLDYFGSAENLFKMGKQELGNKKNDTMALLKAMESKSLLLRVEKELEFIAKNNIQVLVWDEANYPKRLGHCPDAPLILYYKGQNVLDSVRIISMVGSRNASSYGRNICRDLLKELKDLDPLIVSGIAYGIDAYAHQEALNNKIPTVAVLGHGLDMIYPEAHRKMANEMLEQGGLLTEYPSQTIPDRFNFPMRNRIIAGMADVTIVVEAAKRGGALITAECANGYNRDVCAFPGNIYQEYSEGCNYLIKTNRAFPITTVEDLEYLMGWEPVGKRFKPVKQNKVTCNAEERNIVDFLHTNGPANIDRLIEETGMTVSALSLLLLRMELKELVVSLPGKVYIKK